MCGIAGLVNYKQALNSSPIPLQQMLQQIQHRGPDNFGWSISPHNHYGHARLSILDLEHGDQPIFNTDQSVSVVFNGEIFNYIELKKQYLEDYPFYTSTDTEIIVALYDKFGIDFIDYLNGQFAIALFDKRINKTYLIRDRVGICPLYFYENKNEVSFASEIKSLLVLPQVRTSLNMDAFAEFIHLWTPLSPSTLFNGVNEVSPGCYLVIDKTGITKKRYWDFEYHPAVSDISLDEAAHQLDALMQDAVYIRLRSDVPVAAYLSGGLDSTIILSYLKKSGVELSTFSLTFSDEHLNEERYQQDVSHYFNTEHHSLRADFKRIADNFVYCVRHTESPLFRTSPVPMMLLSGKVHSEGYKVVLTGEGSDEVFGGYDIFKEARIREFWSKNPSSTCRPMLLKKLYPYLDFTKIQSADYLKQVFGHNLTNTDDLLYAYQTRTKTTSAVAGFLLDELKDQVSMDMESRVRASLAIGCGRYNVFNTAQYMESRTIMPGYILSSQGDRMLMANSVEGRYPFLDHRVIEFAAGLKNSYKLNGLNEKFILKHMMKERMPESVLNRPKQPYRAPDINALLCSRDNHLLDYLSESSIKDSGLFNYKKVNMLSNKALRGKAQSVKDNMLFTIILSTQIWKQEFLERQ